MISPGRMLAATAAAGCALIAVGVGLAAPVLPTALAPQSGKVGHQLDDRLRQFVDRSRRPGAASTAVEARASGLAATAGRLRVVVSGPGAAQAVTASEGTIEARADGLVQALVEPSALPALTAQDGVDLVRPPASFTEATVTGEGLAPTGAAQFGSAGDGAGTTVAVIDLGFAGWTTAVATGELPQGTLAFDHCSGNLTVGDGHGTGVAEIVHDVAPGARLLLICINSEVTLAQGVDDAIAQGASIINHSVQWFNTGRGDGNGPSGSPDASAARARANGIVWVNAAGNAARTHWSGSFADTNSNGRNEFAAGDEGNEMTVKGGTPVCARLKWDEWPIASSDYDLSLERASDHFVLASSQNTQATNSLPPTETVCWTNATTTDTVVDVVIKRVAATSSPRLDLFTDARLQYAVAGGSIVEPASSPVVIAVGAACWSGTAIEPYSSRGPTLDGRTKPDIVGPDAVSTRSFGPSTSCTTGFTGTSAASPYVAGLLALRRSAQPGVSAADLEASLMADAADQGAAGKDDTTGEGLAWLPLPWAAEGQVAFAVAGASASDRDIVLSSPSGAHPVRLTGPSSDDIDPAIDPTGKRILFTGTTAEGTDVYVINTDGTGLTRLTTNPGADIQPAWSPDGTRIAFASEQGGSFGIWVMNADGTDPARVTIGTARSPTWSPDGTRIVYSALSSASGYDIWVAQRDGTLPIRLTTGAGDETAPNWSPGGRIAYAAAGAIHTIAVDGTGDVTLVQSDIDGAASDPAWSQDGTALLFVKGATLWRSSATGTNPVRLTPPIGTQTPAWGTLPVAPPPPPSGNGGAGGGGGGPDVVLTNVADRATARVGDTIQFRLEARLKAGAPATRVVLTIGLPTNVELVSTKVNRGSGCTGQATVVCDLDFLSGVLVATVEIVVRVTAVGEIVAAGSALVSPSDPDPANNVATARVPNPAPVLPPRSPSVHTGVTRTGTARADLLRGTPFADLLQGLGGADRLFGLGGADRLIGGLGKDVLGGGEGNDTISARDGARDTITCGRGRDTVLADRTDRVAGDCEIVRRS